MIDSPRYSKAKHLCQGTRDCENAKSHPHMCPQEDMFCTCCHECEEDCLEFVGCTNLRSTINAVKRVEKRRG